MIFFILGNKVSLCMKIINSVVVVGLYYGFLTTFSMGPSYLFLLRARVIEEGNEKKVSATTGFITGQLMMFLSIYYAPLHLALGRPHTITVLALPYLLLNFFWNNHKNFFDYGSDTGNSMRKLSIQCVFLNNFILQLFNNFFLPSSMLVRLINISMFQSKNKMLFVITGFIGWLIGHILFMKWVGLILVWIQTNNSIRSNKYVGSNKYLVSELRNSMARIFSILLFITCIYSLGRISSPIFSKKLKKTSEVEQKKQERDIEREPKYETRETKQEEEGDSSLFSEEREDPYETAEMEEIQMNEKKKTKDEFHYHFLEGNQEKSKLEILLEKKEENFFWFEEPPVTILFDSNRWNRPFRYIKNNELENAVRKEMSQYFFYTCQSDGKERISFTYSPSLSTFWQMIEKRMSLFKTEEFSSDELYNHWNYKNEQKKKHLNNEFRNRVEALDKGSPYLNKLEKKTRFCNHETKKEYLPKIYDPLLSGPYRGRIQNEIFRKNYTEMAWINKIHLIFIINNHEFEGKTDVSNGKSFSTEIGYFLNLINEFAEKPISSLSFERFFFFTDPKEDKMDFKNGRKVLQFVFDRIQMDPTKKASSNKYTGLKEISKQVPRWSSKLIDTLEQQEGDSEERVRVDHEIRSRKSKRVIIFTDNPENTDIYNKSKETADADQMGEVALIRYSQQSDFRRDIIKGSIRAHRRKTPVWELFQTNVHSPLFLDRINKSFFFFFSFDIPELMKIIFTTWMYKNTEFTLSNSTEEKKKQENKREEDKRDEKTQIEIAEAWDSILLAQVVRSCVLVTHSFLRKYILLPSLIIAKNITRMLLFQFPEWSEDLTDWKREMHIKCTYNGVPLSEREFPKNWLTEGIQIKILFPFRLKPWHRSKSKLTHKNRIKKKGQKADFCFLTVWGMEAELPFGSPQKHLSLFEVFFKKFEKKIRKWKKNYFRVLRIFKERRILFFTFSEERKNWFVKNILFLQEKLNKFSKSKTNPTKKIPVGEVYELKLTETQKEKGSINPNWTIQKLSPQIQSRDWTNPSLTEKKMKDLTAKTNTTINQIKKIRKEKKKKLQISKKSYNAKSFNLKSLKRILKIGNARLVRKSRFFFKLWVEKIYRDIFLGIINIPRFNAHLFLQSTRKIFAKCIFNNEKNDKRIGKTNPNTIHFISIIKKLVNINNSSLGLISTNSELFCDGVPLSQAYVFYKLSKTQDLNLYKLRSVLQYDGTSQFLKNEIKAFFETQGLLHSKFKNNNFKNSLMNEWKTWLINHYQYKSNLSKKKWSKLIPQKRGNRINQCSTVQNKDLDKRHFPEKTQLSQYEKKKKLGSDPLTNEKENLKKHFRYNLLSYKSLNYEENSNTEKGRFFDMFSIRNYLAEDAILDIEKTPKRKYFDWTTLHFCLNKKGDMESWVELGIKQKEHTKTGTNKYKKIDTKDSFFLTIPQDQEVAPSNEKKKIFDWMGLNDEMLNFLISNLELLFFQKFLILSNAYKRKPWVIPINLLLLNLEVNPNVNEKNKINEKKNDNLIQSRKKKKGIELEKHNYEQKKPQDRVDCGSVLANEEKVMEENFGESTMKSRKQKKKKNNRKAELDFFLKKYLRFQLRWDDSLNKKIITNIKIYCLLLRLTNPREILISYVQRREMNLDILMIQRGLTLTELMKKGILIIEPERLPVKNNGKFIMYHMINILLVHKNKQKINQRYKEKNYVNKQKFPESIERDQSLIGNIEKKDYDLLIPETILSPKRRRELRILISFNSKKNIYAIHKNIGILTDKNLKHGCHLFKPFDRKSRGGTNFKFFLWPNYRLEDLACMNRYWFDANNGSRFSMVRIRIYPRLKSR